MAGAPKVVRLSAVIAVMMGRELASMIDGADARERAGAERERGGPLSHRDTVEIIGSSAVAVARWTVVRGLDLDAATAGQPKLIDLVKAAAVVLREWSSSTWLSHEADRRRLLHAVARACDEEAAEAASAVKPARKRGAK
jgi:hypothetical protein